MKATLAILFLAALGGPIAATNTGIAPTHALVWNDFGAVLAVDGVAIMGGHDGVMTARFDKPQLQFTPLSYSYVSGPIKRLKQTDSLVVAQSAAGSLYFYRRAALPELILLGTVTPQVEYEDFALMGTSLFLARGFEGVTQYRVESYGKLTPVDSTVEPVHAIALETSADRLLVVDDYTGIFGYNPSPVSMGSPVIELNLTSPAGVMAIRDNVAFISLKSSAILKATVWPDSLVVTDTFPAYFSHSRLEVVDTFLVGTSSDGSGFDVVSLSHRQNLIFVDSGWDAFGAAVFSAGDSNYLTIPDDNGGLQLYDLDRIETEMAQPRQAYSAFGAIQAVGTLGSSVVIAQRDRAVTAIALDPTGAPQSPTAVLPGVRNATRLVGVGDRLLGLYPDQRMVAVIRDAGGMFELDTAVEDISAVIHDVRMSDARLDSLRLLFLLGDQFVDVYSVTPHWRLEHSMRLLFPARPTDAALTDSILVIGTDRRLFVYVIRPDLSTEYRATIELGVSAFDPEELVAIVPTEKSNLLLVVTSRSVRSLDLSKPSLPIMTDSVNLPYGLTAAARTGDHLWVMSVDRGLLRVLADGSNPLALEDSMSASGSMIAAVGDLVAVANSHGAHLYDRRTPTWAGEDGGPALPTEITLQQNYPNPFNPETTIEFEIPAPMAVRLEVFNVLGQSVGELIDGMLPSGRHQARFDASRVSSGVYFYRISAGAESRTRKMVVIK